MRWSVTYWRDGDLRTITCDEVAWADLPATGVLWVDVEHDGYRQRLQGLDAYWVSESHATFGVYSIDHAQYGGPQAHTWRVAEPFTKLRGVSPPEGTHILHGVMLADDDARKVGLL